MDGNLFDRQQYDSLDQGLFRKIPILVSNVRDEGMKFTLNQVKTEDDVASFLHRLLPFLTEDKMATLHTMYPSEKTSMPFHNVSQIFSDVLFKCPARKMALTFYKNHLPVTKIMLNYQLFAVKLNKDDVGVVHGSDIPLWWQFSVMLQGKEEKLAELMMQSTTDFSKCEDPFKCNIGSTATSAGWPLYTSASGSITEINGWNDIDFASDTTIDSKCDFFENEIMKRGSVPGFIVPSRKEMEINLIESEKVEPKSKLGRVLSNVKDFVLENILE
jgi:carboxylesterase type B